MYELPAAVGLVPDLNIAAAHVIADLSFLGVLWMAVSVVVLLALLPLAMRRAPEKPIVIAPAERADDLREAA